MAEMVELSKTMVLNGHLQDCHRRCKLDSFNLEISKRTLILDKIRQKII